MKKSLAEVKNQIFEINEELYQAGQTIALGDLMKSRKHRLMLGKLYRLIDQFIKNRICVWCDKKVYLKTLNNHNKGVFYNSALCPDCEGKKANTSTLRKKVIKEGLQ